MIHCQANDAETESSHDRFLQRLCLSCLWELSKIEAGARPSLRLWLSRSELLALAGALNAVSPVRDLIRVLSYQLIHLDPRRNDSIREARELFGELLEVSGMGGRGV